MPVTPEQVLDVAKTLFYQATDEAERRNSASRSYYSLFHYADRLANSSAEVPPSVMGGPTHANLSEYFSSRNSPPRERMMKFRQIGILLRQCHIARCDADYRLDIEFMQQDLQMMHHNCLKGISAIGELA